MSDLREQLLGRLQACVSTIAPGVVFSFPFGYGATPRPMESNLGGGTDPTKARVYSKVRSIAKFDLTDLPAVLIVTDIGQPDLVTALDDQMFERTMYVHVEGYVGGADAGDDLNSSTRAGMDVLLADLQLAVEAFPYWTDTGANATPLFVTHGPVTITPRNQYTEPSAEQPLGILLLDYAISFKFHRLNP